MLIGVILLTSVWGATLQGWVIGYTISLFFYGVGTFGLPNLFKLRRLTRAGLLPVFPRSPSARIQVSVVSTLIYRICANTRLRPSPQANTR